MSSLEFLTSHPPNAGVDPSVMGGKPMSQSAMYMRNNFPIPDRAPEWFVVSMPGLPERALTVQELEAHERVRDRIVLECAGNGRALMSPVPEGTPWRLGGVSLIDVEGVRLKDALGVVPDNVVEIVLTGADTGEVTPEGEINYQFSLRRDTALSNDPLLVTHIGGEPLTMEHGAPVRLVVRRRYAMMSVKWLTRIEGIDHAFEGHFVSKYRYFGDDDEPDGTRVGLMRPRSLIAAPGDGDIIPAGKVTVEGSAWSSSNDVSKVQVSGGGTTWIDAEMTEKGPGLVTWSADLDMTAGVATILTRAMDRTGAIQPESPRWNRNGYANNVQHAIVVTVA